MLWLVVRHLDALGKPSGPAATGFGLDADMPHPPDPDAASPRTGASGAARGSAWKGLDQGSIMGAELVVGILLWSGIGHLVDRWLSTAPWFLLIGAFVGFGGGLYLIWLRSGRMQEQEQAARVSQTAAGRGGDLER